MYLYLHRCQDVALQLIGKMMSESQDYQAYLARFRQLVGDAEVGQLGQYDGKLVKKLSQSEFVSVSARYQELIATFDAAVRRAETVDETVVMNIRRSELEMLIKSEIFP